MQTNVLEYFENGSLIKCPMKIAVSDQKQSVTYERLAYSAKRIAVSIIRQSRSFRVPIAVYLPKCVEVIIADLGILYSGNIYMNLDVKSPLQRIYNIIENIKPTILLTSKEYQKNIDQLGLKSIEIFLIDDLLNEPIRMDDDIIRARMEQIIDTDPLCIINTSGSTGIPKGVVLNHRGTIDFMDWCFARLDLKSDERIGSLSPFFFDIYTLELIYCLAKGSELIIIPDNLAIYPAKMVEYLSIKNISFIFWVPSIMVNISNRNLLGKSDLSRLKTIFFAGEVFPMKHLNQWRRALPETKFVNLYGPIEITVDCTYFIVDREFADNEQLPIGFPCHNTDVMILNEKDKPCNEAEKGELCVRGSSLAMGYWNDSEKTKKGFVQNPINKNYPELIYRTGDIVYYNDRGEIMFVGRKDFQIKHLGYRIELPEIEQQVLCIEGIANACVVYNDIKKEIALFYEASNELINPAFIRQRLSEIFPKYMLPTGFYKLKELPRNPNGKIDRNGIARKLKEEV